MRLFNVNDEVLWYHNGERCYGTVDAYLNDQTVAVWTTDEDGDPVNIEIPELQLRDADDPDDPDPEDPTR